MKKPSKKLSAKEMKKIRSWNKKQSNKIDWVDISKKLEFALAKEGYLNGEMKEDLRKVVFYFHGELAELRAQRRAGALPLSLEKLECLHHMLSYAGNFPFLYSEYTKWKDKAYLAAEVLSSSKEKDYPKKCIKAVKVLGIPTARETKKKTKARIKARYLWLCKQEENPFILHDFSKRHNKRWSFELKWLSEREKRINILELLANMYDFPSAVAVQDLLRKLGLKKVPDPRHGKTSQN